MTLNESNLLLWPLAAALLGVVAALLTFDPGADATLEGARPADGSTRLAWSGSYTQAFQHALDTLGIMGAALLEADPNRGLLRARTPPTALLWHAVLTVTLHTRDGVTYADVSAVASPPPFGGAVARNWTQAFLNAWSVVGNDAASAASA